MRAPAPANSGHLPAWAAIMIIACLLVFVADLWFFIVTGRTIALGLGALALVVAGLCTLAYRPETGISEKH